MKNLSVKCRLYLVVGWLGASLVVIGVLGVLDLRDTNAKFEDVYINRVEPLGQIKTVADLYAVNVVDTTHKTRDGAMTPKQALDSYAFVREEKRKYWDAYMATYLTPEEKQLADQAARQMESADAALKRLEQLVSEQRLDELRSYAAKDMYPAIDPLGETLSKLVALQIRVAKEIYDASLVEYKTTVRVFLFIAVVSLVSGLLLARKIVHDLLTELGGEPRDLVTVMKRIAEGDLSAPVMINASATGSVIQATAQMQERLQAMVMNIRTSANHLSASAGQLSTASTQLAVGIESQSSATSSMAASVEQLAVSVAHVSDSSSEGNKLANSSSELAKDGGEVIQKTTDSILAIVERVQETSGEIARLGDESDSISNVVKVIRDVADQTNLLALNAAIEAARAGDHGRGFAVVADEVRKLAERTSTATVEIGDLIERVQASARAAVKCMSAVVSDVEHGATMAKHAGSSINRINDMSGNVQQVSTEIASALTEQNVACTEIAQNVERVAQMSEENSAATQQVATSAQELSEISLQLVGSVAYFRV